MDGLFLIKPSSKLCLPGCQTGVFSQAHSFLGPNLVICCLPKNAANFTSEKKWKIYENYYFLNPQSHQESSKISKRPPKTKIDLQDFL